MDLLFGPCVSAPYSDLASNPPHLDQRGGTAARTDDLEDSQVEVGFDRKGDHVVAHEGAQLLEGDHVVAHAGAQAVKERRKRAADYLESLDNPPDQHEMVTTSVAAEIVGVDIRTIERWVDHGKITGGRPPVRNSRRWVDARHAVLYAVSAGRAHLVPEKWVYLIPLPDLPGPRDTTGHRQHTVTDPR